MKCLIACDSFKGSLTSKEAGMAIQSALKKLDIDSDYLLISDGGEGYTQALAFGTAFEKHWAMSCDSLFRPRRGLYLKDGDTLYFKRDKRLYGVHVRAGRAYKKGGDKASPPKCDTVGRRFVHQRHGARYARRHGRALFRGRRSSRRLDVERLR